jgi:hypothetical protein
VQMQRLEVLSGSLARPVQMQRLEVLSGSLARPVQMQRSRSSLSRVVRRAVSVS